MFFDDKKFLCKGLLIVIAAGILIRVILGYYLEYNNDVTAFTMTISNIDAGIGLYSVAGYYYPPVWGYMLATFAEVIEHLGVDSLGGYFTEILFMEEIEEEANVSTPVFNLVYTMYLAIGDFLVSLTIYWIIDYFTHDKVKSKIGFALYFLGLNVIVVSAMGAMFDTFSPLMVLICFCFLLKRNDFLAGVMFALAALLKLFPAFLIFILVAYLIKKDRDNWLPRVLKAAAGALAITVVIMLPQILDGNIMDSFTFITARASGSEDSGGLLMKYSTLIVYPILILLEIALSYLFIRKRTDDVDRTFLWFLIIAVTIIFLYPGAPQYIILLTPFLIIAAVMYDKRMMIPLIVLMVGSSIAQTIHLSSEFVAIVLYGDIMSFDTWLSFYDFYNSNGRIVYLIWEAVGNLVMGIAPFIAGVYILDYFGIDLISKVKNLRKPSNEGEN